MKHQHDEEKKAPAAPAKPASLASKIMVWLLIAFLVKLIFPAYTGEIIRQTYVLFAEHYKSRFDLGEVLKQGLLFLVVAVVLVAAVTMLVKLMKKRSPVAAPQVDAIGAMFDPLARQEKVIAAEETGEIAAPVLATPVARSEQDSTKEPSGEPLDEKQRSLVLSNSGSSRNAAFVYAPWLQPFFRELLAHDWSTEASGDAAMRRRGKAQRKALEVAANQSDEHRALYEAYFRYATGKEGGNGDQSPMPVQGTTNDRPLFVDVGLQEFFQQLEAHDWYFAQKSEPARTSGRLERKALEAIARRTPQHMALFKAFRAHQYSGDIWGTPQRPAPLLRSVAPATRKAPRTVRLEVTAAQLDESSTQPSGQQA